jgi:hypothetical protein
VPESTTPTILQTERARLVREIENLTTGIASGGDIPQLVTALKDRDRRLKLLDARLAPKEARDRETLRLALEQRVADWRKILRSNAKQGRMVLQQLVGQLVVLANNDRRSWLAQPRPQGLLVGMVPNGIRGREAVAARDIRRRRRRVAHSHDCPRRRAATTVRVP